MNMINKKNKLWIQITILAFISFAIHGCKLGPGEETFPVPWGGIINRDGTGLEFLFPYQLEARFTENSDGVVYVSSGGINTERGIFIRYLDGTTEKLSDMFTTVDKISRDLNYIFWEEDDIYISDIEGNNKINVTNNTELTYIDPSFSHDSKWLTYVSINADTLSTINLLNLETFELTKIIKDSPETFYQPKYDTIGNVYYFQVVNSHLFLKKYNILNESFYDFDEPLLLYPISKYIISEYGLSMIIANGAVGMRYCDLNSNQILTIMGGLNRQGEYFSINSVGSYGVFDNNGYIQLVELPIVEISQIVRGYSPSISPNGEFIFFLQER
jgi:hypothetical protein